MSAHSSRELVELSGPAVASTLTESSIVVLPTGSIEHHGPHLPLATDLLMADELSARIVDAAAAPSDGSTGLDVWRLPALPYTKSDEHAWAPGTMWLSGDTLMDVLRDLGRSIASTPAKTLVFVNGHGGNVAPLGVALRELRRLYGLRTFAIGVWVPAGTGAPDPVLSNVAGSAAEGGVSGPRELGFGIHGGWGETSLLAHLRPDLVHLDLASRAVPEHLADFQRIGFAGAPVQFGWLSDDFRAGPPEMLGVVGDPTGSTAEAGAAIAAKNVADGVASLREIARFTHRALELGGEAISGLRRDASAERRPGARVEPNE